MQGFLSNNWLAIISIFVGILVAYVFYRLQKKDSASAAAERTKHATNELLDVVETYIINKQKVSEDVIDNLISAEERDHAVVLRPRCTVISLLQDVALRLQRSRHLDIPQKSEYSEKIDELIREVRHRQAAVPAEVNDIGLSKQLAEISELVPAEHRIEVRRKVNSLMDTSLKQGNRSARDTKESWVQVSAALVGLVAAIASSLVGVHFSANTAQSFVDASVLAVGKLLPWLGALMAISVVLLLVIIVIRIWCRTNMPNNEDSGTTAR